VGRVGWGRILMDKPSVLSSPRDVATHWALNYCVE
jgi:hypothetical protein